ncbi:MAG: hypothetical protein E2O88_07505 [Bacteroidetes bacterium]|nr:MAG: hypothetical protein E2O88_07505 [Bacteroidota bacterium]
MSLLLKLAKEAREKYPASVKPEPIYTGAAAVFDYTPELAAQYSLVDRFKKPYLNYRVIGKNTDSPRIMLPRMKYELGAEDRRIEGYEIDVALRVDPRNEDQKRVINELAQHYIDGATGIIVNAATGFGKTYVGCSAIEDLGITTLVLITKSDLEGQWRDSLKKFMGMEEEDIGLIKGDICNVTGKSVVIAYVQSMMKMKRYPSWVYKNFGLVIIDEVHLMAANKFVNCMWQLPAKYRLGLSAKITRSDRKEHVFKDHIGRTLIKADVLPMKFNVVVVQITVMVPKWVRYKAGRTASLNNFLGQHQNRQAIITQKILYAYNKGRNIVCFAETRKHLDYAYDCLVNEGIKMSDIGFYVGMKKNTLEEKEKLKAQALKRIVLATFKMTEYGTDFPHWDTAMLMTPRADIEQTVGRVVRELEGKKIPLVYDFVDSIKLLQNYFKSRCKYYNSKALNIIGG